MISELTAPQRWVWIGLLLMAGDSRESGMIFLRKNDKRKLIGYSDSTIAELLGVNSDTYLEAKSKMIQFNKIKITKDNVIIVVNWNKYQSEYKRQRPYRDKENSNLDRNESNALDIDREIDREREKDNIKPFVPNAEKTSSSRQLINFNFSTRKWENITEEDMNGWRKAFPACSIEHELLGMKEWLLSNPDKKKVRYRRFITNWLGHSQDKGGTKNHAPEDERRKGAIEREDEIIRLWVEEKDEEYKDLAEEILEKRKVAEQRKAEVL